MIKTINFIAKIASDMELDYVKLKDIKPVLSGYLRDAQALLRRSELPDDEAVHDIRVLMKKCRAAIRLVINQTDQESFDRNYGAFREAGRLMSSMRDSSVHRKTLKDLKKSHPSVFKLITGNETIAALMRKSELSEGISPEIKENLEKTNDLLEKAGYRLRFQKMENLDPKLLIMALDESYNTVTGSYVKCRNTLKPADIHELRKKSKDFLYQLYFFRPLNPEVVKSLEKKLDAMTQNLGKYNDLSQLIQRIGYKVGEAENPPGLDELILLIKGEQDKYLSRVWPIAYKIFCPGQKLVNLLGFKILMI